MTKPAKCTICRKIPRSECDWQQGRCPHLPALISTNVVKTRIQNILNFLKGNK